MIQFWMRKKSNAYSNFVASRTDHGGCFPRELLPGILCAARRQIATDYHGSFFPGELLLENLALRANNSALVTVMNQKELWYARQLQPLKR